LLLPALAPLLVVLSFLRAPIVVPLLYLLLFFALFLVLRREWLAWGAVWLFFTLICTVPLLGPSPSGNALTFFWYGLRVSLQVFALARFGLLVMAGSVFCSEMLSIVPLTVDLSAWCAPQGIVMALVMIGLSGYACFTAPRGHRLFGEWFFDDE
jgi:hypothetical protein